MKKILFIDTWTHAERFIYPLIKSLNKDGYKCELLHCDSMFLNSRYKNLKPINNSNYKNYDLKIFNYSFNKALDEINPDKIIYISIHGIIQRWANMVQSKRDIKSFFFMHGIRENNPEKIRKKFIYNLRRVIFYSKVFYFLMKDFFKTFGFSTKNLFTMISYYKELIFNNYDYTNRPKLKIGFNYDFMFVNNKKDINYFNSNYPINKDTKFIISGNVSAISPALKSLNINLEKNKLLFISQTEIYHPELLRKILLKLKSTAKKLNLEIIFRPHPRDSENIEIAKSLAIDVSTFKEEYDFARTAIAAGLNSAMMIGYMHLNTHIIQIVHENNLNITEEFEYKNISILRTSSLNMFDIGLNDFNAKDISGLKIVSPVETIKKIICDS